jgi:hypothetical protein
MHWARDIVVTWRTMLQAGRLRVRFPIKSLDFLIDFSFQQHYGSGVHSASNRNEYQESGYPAVDNITAICKPIIYKMWEPRRLQPYRPQ